MKPIRPVLAAVLAALFVLPAGCKKKSSSSTGGGAAYTSYAGSWKLNSTNTFVSGSCPSGPRPEIALTVDGSGNWTFTMAGGGLAAGTIGSFSGVVSGTLTEPSGCGTGTVVGSCSSRAACSGTHSTTGGATGSASGSWTLTR